MKITTRSISRLFILLALGLVMFSAPGCKSKKKLMQQQQAREQAAHDARVSHAKKVLTSLLTDDNMSLQEKERRLAEIKSQKFKDPEIITLIAQVEQHLAEEKARLAEEKRKADEQKVKEEAEAEQAKAKPQLSSFFSEIAGTSDTRTANFAIREALTHFASPAVPVLIVISEEGDQVDYDRPTNIKDYLNYLKDTHNNNTRIKKATFNDAGKITSLILYKN